MLIIDLLIDLSDLREERDAGRISEEEYQAFSEYRRNQFRRDEQAQFDQQQAEAAAYVSQLSND